MTIWHMSLPVCVLKITASSHVHFKSGSVLKTVLDKVVETTIHKQYGHLIELILRKFIKIVATRCQILRLKCTKFNFPHLAPGELTALARLLS